MKRTIVMIAAVAFAAMAVAACTAKKAGDATPRGPRKVLVAYFSATGTTAGVAKMIAKASKGELYEITPREKYSDNDLDWTDPNSRCCRENDNPDSRPAIAGKKLRPEDYSVIFLGFPNWWNGAPHIVNTFLETYGLKGKTVITFMTSGGSGIENAEKTLGRLYPEVKWKAGRLLNSASQANIDAWVKKVLK